MLTDDELSVIANQAGIHALPTVLSARSRQPTQAALTEAHTHASASLTERKLISNGDIAPDLLTLLRALQRPDRELAMRLVTPDGIARVAVVRSGHRSMWACRVNNSI